MSQTVVKVNWAVSLFNIYDSFYLYYWDFWGTPEGPLIKRSDRKSRRTMGAGLRIVVIIHTHILSPGIKETSETSSARPD